MLKEASGEMRTQERKTPRSFGHGEEETPGSKTLVIHPLEGQKTSGRDVV